MYSTNTGNFILFSHVVNHVFPVLSVCDGALLRHSGVCGDGVGLVVDRPAE